MVIKINNGFFKTVRVIFYLITVIVLIGLTFGIIYLIHLAMKNTVEFEHILIPWKSIILAIIGIFVIVAISMMYATKKVKKDNILDAIREENI